MKRKRRDFSRREQRLIDDFVREICRALYLPEDSEDLRQCAWAAFLSVYRDAPGAFSNGGFCGWHRAYQIIWDALVREQRQIDFWIYGQTSLDRNVNEEIPVPRVELLQAPHSDFQNSVCFYDYLHRMEPDVCRMAKEMIHGSSMEEIQAYYHWSRVHTYRVYNDLRAEMEAYLRI